jgi:mannosyltransferase
MALAAALRCFRLGDKSFWLDEGSSWAIAHLPPAQFWYRLWSQEFNMVAYYELLRAWLHLGSSEAMIRALSVIPAVLTVLLVYELGNHLFDRQTGLLAALLLAVHPAHVAYSQEARGYALAILLCLLSTRLFVRVMESPGWGYAALYALVSALAIYTHFFAVLILAAQAASLPAWPRPQFPWRRLLTVAAAIVALAVPAAIFVLTRDIGQLLWIQHPNLHSLLQLAGVWFGNGVRILCFVLLGAIAVREFAHLRRSESAWPYALLMSWVMTPFLLLLALSFRKPVLTPRFLLICLPAIVILAARGACLLRQTRWPLAVYALLLVLLGASLHSYYRRPKEDWRAATGFVLSSVQPGDAVLVWYPEPFQYYRERFSVRVPIHEFDSRGEPMQFDSLVGSVPPYPHVWLVGYSWWAKDANYIAISTALERDYHARQESEFTGGIKVVRYGP